MLRRTLAIALLVWPTLVQAAVPAGVVVIPPAPRGVPGLNERLTAAFGSPAPGDDRGASALLRSDSSVAVAVLSYADVEDELLHTPDPEIGDLYLRHIPVGGAVVVIAPLSRSIVAVSPVFNEFGSCRPRQTDSAADLGTASEAFIRKAAARLPSIRESDAIGVDLWQISGVVITSKLGRSLLGDNVTAEEAVLALQASDILAASGRVALPPAGHGEAILDAARLRFGAIHGLADSEIEQFSIALPPAAHSLRIIVDGLNSVASEGLTKTSRVYKAWVTVESSSHKTEAVALVADNDLPPGIQGDEGILRTYARRAMAKGVTCAMQKLLDLEADAACED